VISFNVTRFIAAGSPDKFNMVTPLANLNLNRGNNESQSSSSNSQFQERVSKNQEERLKRVQNLKRKLNNNDDSLDLFKTA
jgi:hypothetical protein